MWPSDSTIGAASELHLGLVTMRRNIQRWRRNIGGNIRQSGVSPNNPSWPLCSRWLCVLIGNCSDKNWVIYMTNYVRYEGIVGAKTQRFFRPKQGSWTMEIRLRWAVIPEYKEPSDAAREVLGNPGFRKWVKVNYSLMWKLTRRQHSVTCEGLHDWSTLNIWRDYDSMLT